MSMKRSIARSSQLALDLGILTLAFWFAFLLRFDGNIPFLYFKRMIFNLGYVVSIQYLFMSITGVTRYAWRYIGLREITRIFGSLAVTSTFFLGLRLISVWILPHWGYIQYLMLPIGVLIIDFIVAFLGISGIRILRRLLSERSQSHVLPKATHRRIPTLLIGAGQAGMMVAKEITSRPDLGIDALAFVDDDESKLGMLIHGIPVVGSIGEIATLRDEYEIEQAIITISAATRSQMKRIIDLCEEAHLPTKVIPGIHEIIDGRVNLSRIRDVSVEDLLGREPVQLETDLIEKLLQGRRILVSGAGGSIGSEICRQVARFKPQKLLLLERSEYHLFKIHYELQHHFEDLDLQPLMGDLGDEQRLEEIFQKEKPEVIFHAAAHKHVPMMEYNPGEAIKNNVFGTQKIADAADRHGTEVFVMISTDKAVNPTSVMGASKRMAEIYIQALSQRSKTRYVAVRFGNVLGSTGSVIPIFKDQIARGGPVTVTHPEMRRYFMTIPEASQLVLQAGAMGRGGEIFVLDMGEPVKIVDLAKDLIRMSGLEPDVDVEIRYIGVRPGEKLFEELGFDAEKMDKTGHPKIYIGKLKPYPWEEVLSKLEGLKKYCFNDPPSVIRHALMKTIPEMRRDDSEQTLVALRKN